MFVAATVVCVYNFTLRAFDIGRQFSKELTALGTEEPIEITIPDNATIDQVSALLQEKKVIPNAFLYKMESVLKGTDDNFKGGTYTVNTLMNNNELNAALRASADHEGEVLVTFAEGLSLANMAEYLESSGIVTAAEFLNECENGEFDYEFLNALPVRENRLEGYLFPDTYYISENATAREIIYKMLDRFEEICNSDVIARVNDLGMRLDDIVKIASIIEKEVRLPQERAKASSVIYNRLDIDMSLQMCSTVLYVLNIRRDRITEADLQVESPYNTYINAGLPVGPICNPGWACIEAALYPEDTDLLYFVVKDVEAGEHVFTSDYDEFVNAKIEYNQNY
jgi:UPF0755 protein